MSALVEKIRDRAQDVGEVIDAVAEPLAPKWAEKRRAARNRVQARSDYDGASKRDRYKKWRGMRSGPNQALAHAAHTLRERSRDLVENTWAGSRARSVIKNHVIGTGVIPTPKGENTDDIEALLEDVTSPTYTGLDVRAGKSLYGIQSQAVGTMVSSGDALIVAHWRTPAEMRRLGLAVPLQLRVLEPEHLDHTKTGPIGNGNYVVRGVEFDPQDRPVAYHLYRHHPRDMRTGATFESHRVRAEQVIHLFDELRPGQVHGVPWLTPAMVKMREKADYEDAHLVRQKIAAAFTVFVEQYPGADEIFEDLLPETLEPGTIEYLRPGEEVHFAEPPGVEGLRDFSEITAREIAAGLDLTYEALTTDYSNVNFTSARMGWLEMSKTVKRWQHQIVMPKMCSKMEVWLRMAAASIGVDGGDRRWKWTPPRSEMIDPVRETDAALRRRRAGLSSLQEEIRRHGGNPDEVLREISEDQQLADKLGIILDSDPRHTTQAGLTPARVTNEMQQGEDEEGGDANALQRLESVMTQALSTIRDYRE